MLSLAKLASRPLATTAKGRITGSIRLNRGLASIADQSLIGYTSSEPAPGEPYWQKIIRWRDISEEQFKSYRWQLGNSICTEAKLVKFLSEVLPETLEQSANPRLKHIRTREDFIEDAKAGLKKAPMQIRITPHMLSVINWHNALDDPIRLQFMPLKSGFIKDHPELTLDSLHEKEDSPVSGLTHRYPNKALFLATSICPTYCRFCTRSYAVGGNTETISKTPQKPIRRRWQTVFDYVRETDVLEDIVVSGGDCYYLDPDSIKEIGETLLNIDHIKRIRFASKGLAVMPGRTLDPDDAWTKSFIEISDLGRSKGKQVCLHTHFNHPNEITWVTKQAANHLYKHGVIVRNQSVLLKGVNDDVKTMCSLITSLASLNIRPYYVYQCDLIRGSEEFRTPLQVIKDLEQYIRGTVSGFMMPAFVVDLPEGGGKRLVHTHESYNPETGVSTWRAPGLPGEKGSKLYKYYDPLPQDSVAIDINFERSEPTHYSTTDYYQPSVPAAAMHAEGL